MKTLDLWTLASIGFFIWLFGAVTFRFGGHLVFESGSLVVAISAVSIALSVCVLLSTVMSWRNIPPSQSLVVAVVMALPGLFGDLAYILGFVPITGLKPETAAIFAATVIFGNAALLSFALNRSYS